MVAFNATTPFHRFNLTNVSCRPVDVVASYSTDSIGWEQLLSGESWRYPTPLESGSTRALAGPAAGSFRGGLPVEPYDSHLVLRPSQVLLDTEGIDAYNQVCAAIGHAPTGRGSGQRGRAHHASSSRPRSLVAAHSELIPSPVGVTLSRCSMPCHASRPRKTGWPSSPWPSSCPASSCSTRCVPENHRHVKADTG